MKSILLTILFALFVTSALAQEETSSEQAIQPQAPYLFDQYNPNDISTESEKQKIELFVLQIKNAKTVAEGVIFVYRGASDYKLNAEERINSIFNALTLMRDNASLEPNRFFIRFGGFREQSTVEMIFNPSISKIIFATPSASLSDVKFYDDTMLSKGTIQKTDRELLSIITKKVEPTMPPAAKAVRAFGEVGVLIEIDEKGNVVKSKAILGHPLLRAACESATRRWQFKPQKQNGVLIKVTGIVVCKFMPDDD